MNQRRTIMRIINIALPLIMLFQTVAVSAKSSRPGDIRAVANQTGSTVTFNPSIIPFSDSELVNPMRGFHEWRGMETVPMPETSHDAYQRYSWRNPDDSSRSLETSRGVYNFSEIDADIAEAAAAGKKFGIRIRAMGGDTGGKRYIPDYISSCGWSYNGTFIPDWNGSCFLDNAQNLINALGRRYNGDPRIAFIDIGMYGRWGEWAMDEDIYNNAPSGKSIASDSSLNRIVDMQVNAFPDVRKVVFVKTRPAVVARALNLSNQIGWRVDCLGKDGYFDFPTNSNYNTVWPIMRDRWQTAPVIVEFCASNVDPTYNTAIQQTRDYHIAMIGNGNIDSWSSKSSSQQNNLRTLGKTAGYRDQIKSVTVPSTWTPGTNIAITTRWENVGVAPTYESTNVKFKLYDTSRNTYVWDSRSSVNLKNLLPTNGTPLTVNDSLSLPADVPSGSYQLRVTVNDPTDYRKPLKLANGSRQSDGSYSLGTITVGTSSGGSTSGSATFNPTANSFVTNSSSETNYGTRTTLRNTGNPEEKTYLRFDLSSLNGKTITSARLRIKVSNGAAASTAQNIKAVTSEGWEERSINFNNRPALSSTVTAVFNGGDYNTWVEIDITSLAQSKAGMVFSFAITTGADDTFAFYSRESSDKPQLIVSYR